MLSYIWAIFAISIRCALQRYDTAQSSPKNTPSTHTILRLILDSPMKGILLEFLTSNTSYLFNFCPYIKTHLFWCNLLPKIEVFLFNYYNEFIVKLSQCIWRPNLKPTYITYIQIHKYSTHMRWSTGSRLHILLNSIVHSSSLSQCIIVDSTKLPGFLSKSGIFSVIYVI